TALMLALATNNVFSSGDNARLFGVAPRGDCGNSVAQIVSTARPVSVARTVTVLSFALATNRYLPSRRKTISHGCSPVAQWSTTLPVFKSTTAMFAPAHWLT